MKIFILSNDDLSSHLIFSPLLNSSRIDVQGVAFTETIVKNQGGVAGVLGVLKKTFFEYWLFLIFTNGVFKLYEKLSCLLPHQWMNSLRTAARRKKVPVYSSSDFNSTEFLTILKEAQPDIILIRANQILKEEILNMAQFGVWCLHSSLLPSYKGIAGEFQALRSGEQSLGSSVFKVELELDKGPVIEQMQFAVEPKRSLFWHIRTNNLKSGELLLDALEKLADSKGAPKEILSERVPSYFSWPVREEYRAFKAKGFKLLAFKDIIEFFCFGKPHSGRFHKFLKAETKN